MGISIWQLLIVLLIIVLLFGTKKLRGIGKDMGGAIKGFRDAIQNNDEKPDEQKDRDVPQELAHQDAKRVIEGEVSKKEDEKVQ